MDENCIVIPMGKHELVFEQNSDKLLNKMVFCYLREADTKIMTQDIAVIRPQFTVSNDGENDVVEFSDDTIEVFLYEDENNEDYTRKSVIHKFEGEQ